MSRLLLITHHFAEHCGGLQIAAGQLAEGLARRGWLITWLASNPPSGHLTTNTDEHPSITRVPVGACNITDTLFAVPYPLWGPCGLFRLCLEIQKCDIVHMHDSLYVGNLIAYAVARCTRKPILITQHTDLLPFTSRVLCAINYLANRTLASRVLRGCAQCVFVSHKVSRFFERAVHFIRKPVIIANGVASEAFHPIDLETRAKLRHKLRWPKSKCLALFVGRFISRKNIGLIRQLAIRFQDVHWHVIGYGPDDPATWRLPNVRCSPPVSQNALAAYYQAADLLVLPSIGEGFPMVVQEAMACGLPVLISEETASAMPGVEKVAFVTGLELPTLVRTFDGVLGQLPTLQERGKDCLAFARSNWTWQSCVTQYDDILNRLIAANSMRDNIATGRPRCMPITS
jgi:glycosyltransferase involved in cell wall biosynthesis